MNHSRKNAKWRSIDLDEEFDAVEVQKRWDQLTKEQKKHHIIYVWIETNKIMTRREVCWLMYGPQATEKGV